MLRLFILCFSLTLLACSSKTVLKDEYYRLPEFISSQQIKHTLAGKLLITTPTMRGFSGDRNLIFKDLPNPAIVQRYRHFLWEDSPALMLQDNLSRILEQAKVADKIIKPNLRIPEDYTLTSTVFLFEHHRYTQPTAETLISIEWALVERKCHRILLLKTYRSTMPVESSGINGLLVSYQKNLTTMMQQFLDDLGALSKIELSQC